MEGDTELQLSATTVIKWSVKSELDYSKLDTFVCGSKQQKLNLAFESGQVKIILTTL